MKTVHTPDELKKFQCKHCGKGFWLQNALDIHIMNMHLKLKPYNCRYGCEISYNDKSNRNHHERRKHGKLFISVEEERMEAKMKLVTRTQLPTLFSKTKFQNRNLLREAFKKNNDETYGKFHILGRGFKCTESHFERFQTLLFFSTNIWKIPYVSSFLFLKASLR